MPKTHKKKYKISNETPWQVLEGKVIILSPGDQKAHELDELGTEIWMHLQNNLSVEEIVTEICKSYEVQKEVALKDTLKFIDELQSQNLIEQAG